MGAGAAAGAGAGERAAALAANASFASRAAAPKLCSSTGGAAWPGAGVCGVLMRGSGRWGVRVLAGCVWVRADCGHGGRMARCPKVIGFTANAQHLLGLTRAPPDRHTVRLYLPCYRYRGVGGDLGEGPPVRRRARRRRGPQRDEQQHCCRGKARHLGFNRAYYAVLIGFEAGVAVGTSNERADCRAAPLSRVMGGLAQNKRLYVDKVCIRNAKQGAQSPGPAQTSSDGQILQRCALGLLSAPAPGPGPGEAPAGQRL